MRRNLNPVSVTIHTKDAGILIEKKDNHQVTDIIENHIVHREDGPAIIWENGTKWWFMDNEPHRENGPACLFESTEYYYLEGICYNIDQYEEIINQVNQMSIVMMLVDPRQWVRKRGERLFKNEQRAS